MCSRSATVQVWRVYVVSEVDDAVSPFSRDPATGAVTQVACTSELVAGGSCFEGITMNGASGPR